MLIVCFYVLKPKQIVWLGDSEETWWSGSKDDKDLGHYPIFAFRVLYCYDEHLLEKHFVAFHLLSMHANIKSNIKIQDCILTCTLSSQFPKCSMDMGQSQVTVQEVQLKIKTIKN